MNLIKVAGSGAPKYKFHGHIVIQPSHKTKDLHRENIQTGNSKLHVLS